MSLRWSGAPVPEAAPLRARDWGRILCRGTPLMLVLCVCFPLLLALRPVERAIWGATRPVTPWITQAVCVFGCWCFGLRRRVRGQPLQQGGAMVANHSSWLDIFVLNACARLYFVAKSEVRGWAGIGWLARGTGTLFISRDRRHAARETRAIEDRVRAGHTLMLFPEGTSTDGRRVLAFRSSLFQAFFAAAPVLVQPVSVVYHAPPGKAATQYGWWGDMGFGPSLLKILATGRGGVVDVVFHPALPVTDYADRKALTLAAEHAVRDGFEARMGKTPAV